MAEKAAPCKCKKAECEECPEWIFTFADLVMLMMGFFVILWVLKPNPKPSAGAGGTQAASNAAAAAVDDQWVDTVASIREAFGYEPKPGSKDPIDEKVRAKKDHTTPAGPKDQGQSTVHLPGAVGTDPDVMTIRPGRQSVVGGRLVFGHGVATLSPEMLDQVDQIAEQVRGHRNVVLVKGHASLDDGADTATADRYLELSVHRAEAVASRLVADGVAPDILRVVGCSTFEPVVRGEYRPDAQADNRRVEVEVTPTLVAEMQAPTHGSPDPGQ